MIERQPAPGPFRRGKGVLHLLAVLIVAPRLGGAVQDLQQPAVQFDTRADIVLVDATIVDETGAPIEGIRPEELVVTVDDRPRPLVSAQFVRSDPPAAARTPLPGHFSTNYGDAPGRTILVVVDENSIPPGAGRGALASLDRFITALAPADRIGFVRLPGFENSIDPSADRARLLEAIKQVVGRAQSTGTGRVSLAEAFARERNDTFTWLNALGRICGSETGQMFEICAQETEQEAMRTLMDVERRARESLQGLEQLMSQLGQFPGAKTLVLLSQGLLVTQNGAQIERVAAVAGAARVGVYVLQMDLPSMDIAAAVPSSTRIDDERLAAQGLENLAAAARGARFRIVGSGEGVFQRIASELSGYYLLGIEPIDADRDGRPHRLKVEVQRRGAVVRARSQFTIEAPRAIPSSPRDQLIELLRSISEDADFPLRVAAFTTPAAEAGQVKVIVSAEVGAPATAPADVEVGFVLLDNQGTLVGNQVASATLAPSPDGPAPLSFIGNADVPPGDYTLRLAAVDAERRGGSVHHPVVARLREAGPVRMSDLIVGAPARDSSGVRPEVHLTLRGPSLQSIVELTSSDPRQLGGTHVTFEVAEEPDGAAIVTARGRMVSSGDSIRPVTALIDVGVLPAGSYFARAVASVPGEKPVSVIRPFDVAPRRASAAAAPVPAAAGRGRVRPALQPFRTTDVLAPDVLNPFVNHLLEAFSPSPAARAVLESLKAGDLAQPADEREAAEVGLAFARGVAMLAANRAAEAEAYFRIALRQSADFLGATFYLGAALATAGRERDAIGAWQTALIGEVGAAGVYPVLIDGLLRVGDAEEALAFLAEAEQTFTDRPQYVRRLAQAYALAGRHDDARPLAHEYLATHPDDLDMLLLAMHLVYEAHADGRLPADGDELRRFATYASRYDALRGPQTLVVRGWRKALGIR